MEDVFLNHKLLLEDRLNKLYLIQIGEDSIRYDFFVSLMQTLNLKPSQIQIEFPLHENTFIPKNEKISYRNEKPLIDLKIMEENLRISVEFGLFKQNSNENGTIDKTARLIKTINDMIRVALESHYTNSKGYFICVADEKMLKHQIRSKVFGPFPSSYEITMEKIDILLQKKTSDFDNRFLKVFNQMNKTITSRLVYDKKLEAVKIRNEARLCVWEVQLN